VAGSMALWTSGRLRVILAMPSRVSKMMAI
jgi:hypothetical protein